MSSYKPISCRTYDDLVLLSMHREEVEIQYRSDGNIKTVHTTIRDIQTRDSVEYALLGTGEEVRLDELIRVNGQELLPRKC